MPRKGNVPGVNRTLRAFSQPEIDALPVAASTTAKPKVTDILSNPQLRPVTLLLAFGYMFHTITFYYILKFAVQIVSDYPPGYPPSEAATVLTWANVGGFSAACCSDSSWPELGHQVADGADAAARFGGGRLVRPRQRHVWTAGNGRRSSPASSPTPRSSAITPPSRAASRPTPAAPAPASCSASAASGAAGTPIIAGALFNWLGNDELLTVSAIMAMGSIVVAAAVPACCRSATADEVIADDAVNAARAAA